MADETKPNTSVPGVESEAPESEAPESEAPESEAPESEAPESSAEGPVAFDDEERSLDPQLIALCVVLWLVAVGIFSFRWTDMRIDYHLGNLRQTVLNEQRLDPEATAALVSLADDGVLAHLVAELNDPTQNQPADQLYRVAVLRVVGQIPGEDATGVLLQAARDLDTNMRANAFEMLAERASGSAREPIVSQLEAAASRDPALFARAHAARHLARVTGAEGAWPLIRSLRELDADIAPVLGPILVAALREVSGKSEEELPLPGDAPLSDDQVRAVEVWFRESGGTIPAGESIDEVRSRERAEAPEDASGAGSPPESEPKPEAVDAVGAGGS